MESRIYTSNSKRHNSKVLIKDVVVFSSATAYNVYLKNKGKKWGLKTSYWPQWTKQKI